MNIFTKKEIAKLPPQAIDIEEAILGCMLIDTKKAKEGIQYLKKCYFYKEANQHIFAAISELHIKSIVADILSVAQQLKATNLIETVGGAYYISQLSNKANPSNFEYYCKVIIEKWMRREVIRLCYIANNDLYDETIDIFDYIKQFKKDVENITIFNEIKDVVKLKDVLKEVFEHVCQMRVNPDYQKKLLTGIDPYDSFCNGLEPGNLITIAGESSHGKTAFATQIAVNVCKLNTEAKGIFYSFEMTQKDVTMRIIARETGISAKQIKNFSLDNDKLNTLTQAIRRLENLMFYFDERIINNSSMIMSSIINTLEKYKPDFIVLDYLQLINSNTGDNYEQEIAAICNNLKGFSIKYNCTIILISQLAKGEGKPTTKRLKYSSAIEQASDQIIFVYRPNIANEDQETTQSIAEINVAKGRSVGLLRFKLWFCPQTTSFSNYNGEDQFYEIKQPF